MDAAEPSTNGVSASNLHRLGALLDDEEYTTLAGRTVAAFATEIIQHPFGFSSFLGSIVAARCGGVSSVVFAGEGAGVEEAVAKVRRRVRPGCVVARVGAGTGHWLRGRNGLVGAMKVKEGEQRVQVCAGGVCRDANLGSQEGGDTEGALKSVGL